MSVVSATTSSSLIGSLKGSSSARSALGSFNGRLPPVPFYHGASSGNAASAAGEETEWAPSTKRPLNGWRALS
jgi:hypothetical protein